MKLNENQLDTLRHMLGINDPYKRIANPYRNYAAVDPGNQKYIELERIGAVERFEARVPSGYHWYQCTEVGRLAAIRSFRTIQKSKAQRRYMKFLDVSDYCHDLTFKDFLTLPEFKESRDNA